MIEAEWLGVTGDPEKVFRKRLDDWIQHLRNGEKHEEAATIESLKESIDLPF